MKRRYWFSGLLIGSLLLAVLILTDAVPLLRGPQPDSSVWHWPYQLRPFIQWWPVLLVSLLYLPLAQYWLNAPPLPKWHTAGLLLTVTGLTLLLQLSLVFADNERPFTELVNRTLAVQTNGYFWTAANLTNLSDTLNNYPALMTQFESDHARTHPPGLLLANWHTIQTLQNQPALTNALAPSVWHARCTDLWLLDSPPNVAAALGVWAILPLVVAATAVFPTYLLTKQLGTERQARLAALLVPLIPSLLIFSPTPDQISVTLALWLIWFAMKTDVGGNGRLLYFAIAGLLLSLLSFISLGNAALLLLLLFYWLLPKPASGWLRELTLFAICAASIWLIYWPGWGVPPWQIAFAGLAEHEALVIEQRRYAIWTLFNLVDVLIFTGLPIVFGFLGCLFIFLTQIGRNTDREKNSYLCSSLSVSNFLQNHSFRLTFGTFLLLLLLNFSGSTRGEVGRIWLFLFPLLAIGAALFFGERLSRTQLMPLLAAQLLLALAVGLAWQPISATIVVAERPFFPLTIPETETTAQFNKAITLQGYTLTQNDNRLDLTLFWQADARLERPFTVFNHLLNTQGELVTQADGWSGNGQWPTSCWSTGERVVDQFSLTLPEGIAAGEYQLVTGFYDARDNGRLPLPDGSTAYTLQTIQIGSINE